MMKRAIFVESQAARRILIGALTLLVLINTAVRPVAAHHLSQDVTLSATMMGATSQSLLPTPTALPTSLALTSQPPTPTGTAAPVAPPAAWWQAETPAWLTALGFLLTLILTTIGWWLTQKQQRALAKEQQQLAGLQERMIRERELVTSNAAKLRALGEYLEFPNHIATCLDLRTIRQRYDQEWEHEFGLYQAYAFRYDELAFGDEPGEADSGNLGQLVIQIDTCIDEWIEALAEGVDLKTASDRYLIQAMQIVEVAVKRLNAIERRLLLNDMPIPDVPVRTTH